MSTSRRRRERPVRHRRRPAAVLFDLDDTLFDHSFASAAALRALRRDSPSLRRFSAPELQRRYRRVLDRFHLPMLRGVYSLRQARRRRLRALFEEAGETVRSAELDRRIRVFRRAYRSAQRPVPGARPLLRALAPRVQIVIVSNNRHREQFRKLRDVGLRRWVDAVVTSESAGTTKPSPEIFRAAVERAGVPPDRCLVIGNSWVDDVRGARGAGLRAVWYAPRSQRRSRAGVPVLRSLRPAGRVARWLEAQVGDRRRPPR